MAAFKEPKKFGVIPGNAADVTAIQDASSVLNPSMAGIFPAIYQVPLGQGGKAPERTTFNQFFKLYGEALYFLQRGGVWSYDATADYPAGAVVGYSGSLYLALKDNGSGTDTGAVTPGRNTSVWQKLVLESGNAIYDLVPDGAASHRNFYRGKDLTAVFNAGTVSEHIADGSFRDIFPGDYITKQITVPQILKADGTTEYIAQTTYNVRFIIADLDIWLHRGDTSCETHHVAIVPEYVVFNSCMNETNTTEGGYVGSYMNQTVMPAFATGLQGAFGASHLISFRIGLSNGVTATTASASHPYWTGTSNWWGAWTSEICCLMSEGMVYGQSPNHSAAMDETMCGQFAAFRLNSNLVYIRQNYWLSDVVSSARFALVFGDGRADAYLASLEGGVRPFALLR